MRKTLFVGYMIIAACLISASVASAKDKKMWSLSDKIVRVQTDSARAQQYIFGRIQEVRDSSLVLQVDSSLTNLKEIPFAKIRRVEIKDGKHGHFWAGAAIGTGLGLLVAIPLAASVSDKAYLDELSRGFYLTVIPVGGFLLGGVMGATFRSDKWESVSVQNLKMSVTSTTTVGIQLNLKLPF